MKLSLRDCDAPRWRAVSCLVLLATIMLADRGWCLTPDSPEVKAAVAKGIKFLRSNYKSDDRVGALALTAMAIAKENSAIIKTDPIIQEAVNHIRAEMKKTEGDYTREEQIYNLGISVVFLSTIDDGTYNADVQAAVNRLVALQKPAGGWGYPNNEPGDTSMTQYGVLSLWESTRAGASVPKEAWEKAANWLMRVQAPNGSYGYQGVDPGIGTNKQVEQDYVKLSLTAASLGALYICRDQFDLAGARKVNTPATGAAAAPKPLNSALKSIVTSKERNRQRHRPATVDATRFFATMQRGDAWIDKNFLVESPEFTYYYHYAYERYRSFREQAEGDSEEEPKWYTDIGKYLLGRQTAEGYWDDRCGQVPDTAFACLFLLRSTKKAIQEEAFGKGELVGGRGLDGNNLVNKGGNIVQKPLSGPADELIKLLGDQSQVIAAVDGLQNKKLSTDEALVPEQVKKLEALTKGNNSPEARMAALRILGRTRDLDHVPTLIHALADPHWGVVAEAREALRFISRKFFSGGPQIIPTSESSEEERKSAEPQRRRAIEEWKAWYLTLRPDYVFED